SNYVIDYDSNHQPVSITDANNVKAEYTYDSRGNISQVVVTPSSGTGSVLTQNGYSGDGRFITTVTDERGKVTTYNYNSANGLLNYVNDANNNQTRYKYNVYKAITDIFADLDKDGTIDSNEAKVSYVYDSHRNLTQIVTRTTTYNLTYDPFGNVSGITVGSSSTPLAGYTYANYNGKLTRTDYANGMYVENVYDSLDRTVQIKYGGTVRYSVSYDKSGSVASIYDHENEIEYLYEYDRLGRLVRYYEFEDGEIRTVSAEQYDDKGRTSKITYKNDGYTARQTSYNYDNTGRVGSIILPGNEYEFLSYDTFGRQYFRSYYRNAQFVMGVTNGFEANYFNGASHTSSAINNITYNFYKNNSSLQYSYVYDNVGNITSVSAGQTQLAAYTYDGLNQLTQEVNNESGRRYVYEYDLGGNITSVKTYNGTVIENTDTYSYTDSNWQDKLTAFNGHTITYDDLGNPLSYYNGSSYTFTWKDGRKLATLSKGSTSVSYKYNSDGIRYEKTVNGVVHKYYLMGSTITAETIIDGNTTTYIEYFYDSTGPYGFSIDGTFYYYIKNLQGDVTQIRDENNNLIASYVYDAWGKVLTVTENNTSAIGAKNPIRYRGYYYDAESDLYYLNARYYDPQIRRFISSDSVDYLGYNGNYCGWNMYSYCGNNPIIRADYNGKWWIIVAIAVFVTGSCLAMSGCSKQNKNNYGNAYSYKDLKTSGGYYTPNCYAYAIGLKRAIQPGYFSGEALDTRYKYTIDYLVDLVCRDLKALGRGCRKLKSINDEIRSNEYRIAVRHGKSMYIWDKSTNKYRLVKSGGNYDYHFMVQLNDGTWSEKHGTAGSSIPHYHGETPDTLSWDLGNLIGYYNSDIRYLAITR
ncbi:MAG: RHS repeat protein, partial [Clostridia bacterium]|nr:RHS repeat protein [Clostridia bacterium]